MKNNLRRALALLLVLTLLVGIAPAVFADEVEPTGTEVIVGSTDPPNESTAPPEETGPVETTTPPGTEPPETTAPPDTGEETEPTTTPTEAPEPTEPPEDPDLTVPEEIVSWELEEGDALTSFANQANDVAPQTLPDGTVITVSSKVSWYVGNTEFWWYHEDYGRMSDKCSTSSAVYFELSDGRIGFCTQCFKDSVEGNYNPSGWYRWIDSTARSGIARILTYGAPNNGDTSDEGIKATALAIWDMAAGYYKVDGTSRGHGTAPFYANTSGTIRAKYDEILAKIRKHGVIPSFATDSKYAITSAQTITLTYDRTSGLYKGSATDTNGVLADFNFTSSISGLTFSKSGNTLNITATDAAAKQLSAGVTIKNRGHEVEVGTDSCTILASADYGTDKQLIIILDDPIDPVPCYFKLLAVNPTGDIEITKHTSSGTSLSGWKFEVFTDSACTNRVAMATSGADGKAKVTGLTAGTYYVREVDESSTYPWWGYDKSVKTVTVTEGGTATVSFNNTLLGRIAVQKITSSGGSLGGWTFEVFSDAACTQLVETMTTDTTGKATSGYLVPGTYYVREVDESGTYPWWSYDQSVKVVTVSTGGGTATVSFTNVQNGRISIQKTTNTGKDLDGWQFGIYSDSACTQLVETITTDESGKATSGYLAPGTYYVKELDDGQHPDWTLESDSKAVTVVAGETATVNFENIQNGRIKIIKEFPDTGVEPPLEGWQFKVTDSEGNEIEGSPFTVGADGTNITGYIAPGTYTVEELIPEGSLFECLSENPQTITIAAGETGSVTFTNSIKPARIEIRKVDPMGNSLAGARFLLEWYDGVSWIPVYTTEEDHLVLGETSTVLDPDGYLTTGADGIAAFEGLFPGYPDDPNGPIRYRLTEVEAPSGYLLLTEAAWEGTLLDEEGLSITLTVHNSPGYSLPEAGSDTLARLPILGAVLVSAAILGQAWCEKRKEVEKGYKK